MICVLRPILSDKIYLWGHLARVVWRTPSLPSVMWCGYNVISDRATLDARRTEGLGPRLGHCTPAPGGCE
jgi:hypothetical protein